MYHRLSWLVPWVRVACCLCYNIVQRFPLESYTDRNLTLSYIDRDRGATSSQFTYLPKASCIKLLRSYVSILSETSCIDSSPKLHVMYLLRDFMYDILLASSRPHVSELWYTYFLDEQTSQWFTLSYILLFLSTESDAWLLLYIPSPAIRWLVYWLQSVSKTPCYQPSCILSVVGLSLMYRGINTSILPNIRASYTSSKLSCPL